MRIAARLYGRVFLVQTWTPNVYTVAKLQRTLYTLITIIAIIAIITIITIVFMITIYTRISIRQAQDVQLALKNAGCPYEARAKNSTKNCTTPQLKQHQYTIVLVLHTVPLSKLLEPSIFSAFVGDNYSQLGRETSTSHKPSRGLKVPQRMLSQNGMLTWCTCQAGKAEWFRVPPLAHRSQKVDH